MRLPLFFLLALLLSACSLAGDATPPPGWVTVPPSTPAPTEPPIVEPLLPEARPVAFDGGVIYQERCAPCHGPTGSGGGELSSQLPAPPPDFADPATLRGQPPQDLFRVLTQGRVEQFMPPFGDSLSVAERWNAVAYLYTLSLPSESMTAGQAVYTTNCARCHGDQGQGDGPDAAGLDHRPPNLSDHAYAAIRSAEDYAAALNGDDPAHAFAGVLSEADRWAAVDYARALAYDYSPPEALLAEGQGAVRGQVVNGTAGATAPAGLAITLYGFEGENLMTTLTTTAGVDGGYAFDAVDFAPGRQFVVTTQYQGVDYNSEPASFRPGAGEAPPVLELPLPVYETTAEASGLTVSQAHMFLEFTDPQSVTIGELFVFSNSGDKTIAAQANQPLAFSLPAGATALNVQGGELGQTYFATDQGFAAVMTIPPGEATSQILYSYRLPYAGEVSFSQPLNYPVENVNLLVADLGVTVAGPGLQTLGVQELQGETFQTFSQGALAAGDQLTFSVAGEPGALDAPTVPGVVPPTSLSDTSNLAVGLGALGLVLLGIGYYLFRRPPALPSRSRDDLLQELADLDDAFAAHAVEAAAYRQARARLMGELREKWR